MNEERRPPQQANIDISSIMLQLATYSEVYLNLPQAAIITTEDKILVCLSKHLRRMERKRSWMTPLGIFVAIAATFVTSTFKDFGLDAAYWYAIFFFGALLSLGWLVVSVIAAFKSGKPEDIVDELKKGGLQIRQNPNVNAGI